MDLTRRSLAAGALGLAGAVATPFAVTPAFADHRSDLVAAADSSLHQLLNDNAQARFYYRHCRGVLVFPNVLKAGFIFGGETGNGVLFGPHGRTTEGFFNLSGGSWGLQIGGQDFAYALFFMTASALEYLHKSAGFAVGTGPSIVVINAGAGKEANSTTITHDVYAFPYNHKGLMADLTLQGTKITQIHPG
ncbi:MAG: lipid-binding SYLF domain-containing protein [Caulobacteraceae bacterium]|nr:lipid-binding SYLF domain-containing protein [Caulobacteraceae bacterium]